MFKIGCLKRLIIPVHMYVLFELRSQIVFILLMSVQKVYKYYKSTEYTDFT